MPIQKLMPSPLRERAKDLRKIMTPAEARLWEQLRGRRLAGLKFRRQHVVCGLIADFYCASARLIVEVDGGIHLSQAEEDEQRSQYLREHGYRVLRLRNDEIETNLESVLSKLQEACRQASLLPYTGEGAGG